MDNFGRFISLTSLAESAYQAYGEDAKWLTWNGKPMPQWDELNDEVRFHWIAAVTCVANNVIEDSSHYIQVLNFGSP